MKSGQTIVAERERLQSASERMEQRRALQRKKTFSRVIAGLLIAVVVVGLVFAWIQFASKSRTDDLTALESTDLAPKAEVVDETMSNKITTKVKEYAARLEADLADAGYTVTRFTVPSGTSRELYVDLSGYETYFKVNIDRGEAVTAEDIGRMVKYLGEQNLKPEYVDVRVAGKAYYK